jgi:hypothetical protein
VRWPGRRGRGRLAAMGVDPTTIPEVFTLVPRDDRPDRQILSLEELQWLRRFPYDRIGRPPPDRSPSTGLVFRRWPDGRVTVDSFPDEVDVCEPIVARLDPHLVRLERGRLYVTAASGVAVYVPVGPSPRPGCRRYGRLYRRLADR